MDQAVVLGGTGALGKGVVDALLKRNISTKVLVRDIEKFKSLYPEGQPPGRVGVIQGNLDSNQSLADVMEGADTVFPCFNTKLHKWSSEMTRWIGRVGDLSAALQAKIVFPSTIFTFGPGKTRPIDEETEQDTTSSLGQLRIAMEQRFVRSAFEGAILTVLRFPDIFGPACFDRITSPIFRDALKGQQTKWFGNPSKLHDFISTADAGEAMVLAGLEPKTNDAVFHVPGPAPIEPQNFISNVYRLSSSSITPAYRTEPNWQRRVRGMFDKDEGLFVQLKYLYEENMLLDGSKFDLIVGKNPNRPFEETIKETLDWFSYWINSTSNGKQV